VPVLILGFFPWIAFVPAAAVHAIDSARTRAGSLERLALTWTIVPLVFFSFAETKLPNYIALMLPALAIIVALWFERVSDAVDRRAAIASALSIPLLIGALGIAIVVFIHNNHLESTTAIVVPQAEILGAVMLIGSLATVAAIATRERNWIAPYVLGATSGALVLFIAFVAEPAAETFKPIPGIAHVIQEQRAPGSEVAIRGVAGSYSLIFYTEPGVKSLDEAPAADAAAICAAPDEFLVTRARDVDELTQMAGARRRNALELGRLNGVSLLHLTGSGC
jgi:4-amino-4-deoxy-L-arabinose transferase-like glycosyltransferase